MPACVALVLCDACSCDSGRLARLVKQVQRRFLSLVLDI